MSKYNKYASDGSGALNPAWFSNQEFQKQLDDYIYACNYLNNNMNNDSYNYDNNYTDDIGDILYNIMHDAIEESKPMCRVVDNQITLEDQFNFLKAHSDSEEDLMLAEKVLYYHNIK